MFQKDKYIAEIDEVEVRRAVFSKERRQVSVGFVQRPAFLGVDALLGRKAQGYDANSRSINIKVVRAVCEVAEGAIGPYAMNKLLSGTGVITSDGLTLVKEMRFRTDQPVVNLLLRALDVQDREAGDGSTRMLLLVGGLLDEAEKLMEKHVHPSRVSQWFEEAALEATEFLAGMAKRAEGPEDQLGVAITASAGKFLSEAKQGLVSEIVRGVRIVTEARGGRKVVDREALSIEVVDSGNATDSFLLRGCLVWGGRAHPEMPKTVKNPKVAIVDFPLDCFNKPGYASRMPLCRVESVARIGGLQEVEEERVKLLRERIDAIAKSRADVVVCKRGVGDLGISMLARRGLFAMERVMREVEVLRLSKTTGAKIMADPINITSSDLGIASLVEEREFAGKRAVFFENRRNARAATLVIFGVNAASAGVNKRSAETAVGAVTSVVECSRVVPGGGGAEAAASRFLKSRALEFSSKKQLVYESFATALMVIPAQIAKSTGTDAIRLVSDLIRCHETGDVFGIDAISKGVADMYKRRIIDPLRVASGAIRNASDFVCQLLDVDLTLNAPRDAPKEGEEQRTGHVEHKNTGTPDRLQLTLAETAETLGGIFASSLGPFGSRKCVVGKNDDISLVKDGLSIASALARDHPVVKVIREVAEVMNATSGDGVSSAVVILGSLMNEAAKVISAGIHPLQVIEGFGLAAEEALSALEAMATFYPPLGRRILESVAITPLRTKLRMPLAIDSSRLIADATRRLAEQRDGGYSLDQDAIFVTGKTGSSEPRMKLVDGLILDKTAVASDMPKRIEGASAAILDSLEMKGSTFDVIVELVTPDAMKTMIEDETRFLENFIVRLKGLKVRFVACKGGIDDYVARRLSKEGILAVKLVSPEELRRLERATGAQLAIPSELTPSDLGWAGTVEESGAGEERYILLSRCRDPKTVSLVLRRGNKDLAGDAVKAINSSLILLRSFLEDPRVVSGGAATEVELSVRIQKKARSVVGRQQMAMEAFSRAILSVPEALSQNAGLDPLGTLAELIAAHKTGLMSACLDLESGGIADAVTAGLLEPLAMKRQVIRSACDAAVALLRCDEAFTRRGRGNGKVRDKKESNAIN